MLLTLLSLLLHTFCLHLFTWHSRLSLFHPAPCCDTDPPISLVVLDDHASPRVIVGHHLQNGKGGKEEIYECISHVYVILFDPY